MRARHILVIGSFLIALLLHIDYACISVARGPIVETIFSAKDEATQGRLFGWVLPIFTMGYALAQAIFSWFPTSERGLVTGINFSAWRLGAAADGSGSGKLPRSPVLRPQDMRHNRVQYFCSNFTFSYLGWLYPHIEETYEPSSSEAGYLAALPLIDDAADN